MSFHLIKPNDNIQRIINLADAGDTLIFPAMCIDFKRYNLKSGLKYVGVGTIAKSFDIKDHKNITITGFIFKKSWSEKLTIFLFSKPKYAIKVCNSTGIEITYNRIYN